ncbi:MAG: Asp23/Gls24 family envelope stress response protein [Ruminococcaceae bacterium]|nr:Asp23/Gls24 family envelope stress response protein [Oscillospiraceae bacterium]
MAIKTETQQGSIIMSNTVIAHIAGMVATGCYGVVGMAYKNAGDTFASLLKWDTITKGIKVSTEDDKISIDLHIIVEYGVNIKVVSDSIISNVRYTVEDMTGFHVDNITVNVEGIRVD